MYHTTFITDSKVELLVEFEYEPEDLCMIEHGGGPAEPSYGDYIEIMEVYCQGMPIMDVLSDWTLKEIRRHIRGEMKKDDDFYAELHGY